MTNFKELSEQILDLVGGEKNIKSVFHCVTRLRLTLEDQSKVEKEKIEKLEGVHGSKFNGLQYQIIIGPDVEELFEAFIKLVPETKVSTELVLDDAPEQMENRKKKNPISIALDAIAKILIPAIPALCGAGIVQTVLMICTNTGILSAESSTYQILYMMGQTTFFFLPIIVAVSAAEYFKMNKFLAIAVVGALLYPTMTDAVTAGTEYLSFLGLPVKVVSYSSTLIPALLTIWLGSYLERFFKRLIPNVLHMVLLGASVFLVLIPIELIVLGPIGSYVGDFLGSVVVWMNSVSSILTGAVLGGGHLVLVLVGAQSCEVPVMMQEFASGTGSLVMAITSHGNTALCGAMLGVWLKGRKSKNASTYAATAISAISGITEPALFGVAVGNKKVLLSVIAAGAIGGVICAIGGFGFPMPAGLGVFTPLLFIGQTKWVWYLVSSLVTLILAFLFCFVTFTDTEKN